MKSAIAVVTLLMLSGCGTIGNIVQQSQATLEQANHLKGMEAMEIVCNRLYTKTFQELYPTKEQVDAWKTVCRDRTELTP